MLDSPLFARRSRSVAHFSPVEMVRAKLLTPLPGQEGTPGYRTINTRTPLRKPPALSSPLLDEIRTEKRRRTICIRNAAESTASPASRRQQHDEDFVRTIFDYINVQVRPVSVYRAGKSGEKPRFLLAELPSRALAVEVLRSASLLKDGTYSYIYLGLSMSPEERHEWFQKRREQRTSTAQPPAPLPAVTPSRSTKEPQHEAEPADTTHVTHRKRETLPIHQTPITSRTAEEIRLSRRDKDALLSRKGDIT